MEQSNRCFIKRQIVRVLLALTLAVAGCGHSASSADTAANFIADTQDEETGGKAGEESLADDLKRHVVHLAEAIGERNLDKYDSLCAAADYIDQQFQEFGFETSRQSYQVSGLD